MIDEHQVEVLIVDLRDNGGGNSMVFNPFVKETKKRDWINQKENLYVILGRRTFSSAVLNSMELKKNINATLIGEPTAGKPNHYGEVKSLYLANVDLSVYYFSNYFKRSSVEVDAIYPDIQVNTTAGNFFDGKDDVLEYIFHLKK